MASATGDDGKLDFIKERRRDGEHWIKCIQGRRDRPDAVAGGQGDQPDAAAGPEFDSAAQPNDED